MAAGGHATITGLRIKKELEEEEKIRTHTGEVQEIVRTPSRKVEPKLENPVTGKNPKPKGSKTSEKKAKSVRSRKSGLSNLFSVSTLYLKQETKVEKAHVRLKYAKRESELLKERAALDAKMNILDKESKFEECNQGLNALNEPFDLEPTDEEGEEEDSNDRIYLTTVRLVLSTILKNKIILQVHILPNLITRNLF